jgi:hypothetical protein
MSSVKYATVKPGGAPRTGGLGQRSDVNLSAAFATPVGTIYSEEAVKNAGIAALNGNGGPGDKIPNIGVANGVVNDGGYMFGTFDLNFASTPNLDTVDTGGEGRPASPYVPNLTSPGPGSTYASDQPEYTGILPEKGNEYGGGLGAVSPSATSPKISGQTIGSYLMGRSYLGSDGKS